MLLNERAQVWIKAARPQTLFLSLAGVIVGSALAYYYNDFSWKVFILALLTASSLQILSNFANDYGDGVKGTDQNRIGPERGVQSGKISPLQMKRAVILFSIIAFIFGLALVYVGCYENLVATLSFIIVGILAIAAALKYTIGKSAYGYKGYADIFVFIFFGLVSVCGTFYLHTNHFVFHALLPAASMGFLSTAVLNINNLRDEETDKLAGKNTLVVKMGYKNGITYQFILLISAFFSSLLFTIMHYVSPWQFLFVLPFVFLFYSYHNARKIENKSLWNNELKKTALLSFAYSILFFLGIIFR